MAVMCGAVASLIKHSRSALGGRNAYHLSGSEFFSMTTKVANRLMI